MVSTTLEHIIVLINQSITLVYHDMLHSLWLAATLDLGGSSSYNPQLQGPNSASPSAWHAFQTFRAHKNLTRAFRPPYICYRYATALLNALTSVTGEWASLFLIQDRKVILYKKVQKEVKSRPKPFCKTSSHGPRARVLIFFVCKFGSAVQFQS